MSCTEKTLRVLIIGLGALGGSALSAIAGLFSLVQVHSLLEPSRWPATRDPWWWIPDPVTGSMALATALPFAILTFGYGLFTLWKTELWKTVPIVIVAGVGAVVVTAPFLSMLSALVGLAVTFAVMTVFRFADGSRGSRPSAAERDGEAPAPSVEQPEGERGPWSEEEGPGRQGDG